MGSNPTAPTILYEVTLVYYSGGQRLKRNFASLDEAKRGAEIVAVKLAHGESEVLI